MPIALRVAQLKQGGRSTRLTASGEMRSVMATHHTACAAEFSPVVAPHRVLIAAVKAVDADPIAPMVLA